MNCLLILIGVAWVFVLTILLAQCLFCGLQKKFDAYQIANKNHDVHVQASTVGEQYEISNGCKSHPRKERCVQPNQVTQNWGANNKNKLLQWYRVEYLGFSRLLTPAVSEFAKQQLLKPSVVFATSAFCLVNILATKMLRSVCIE